MPFVDGEATSWTFRVYRGYPYRYSARVQDDGGSASGVVPECSVRSFDIVHVGSGAIHGVGGTSAAYACRSLLGCQQSGL